MSQTRFDLPKPRRSIKAYVREQLRDLPLRQAARKQRREARREVGTSRPDREAQQWLEGFKSV
jgi:hypothetical protein